MITVSESPNPSKQAEREAIAAQVAEYEKAHGKIQTTPLRDMSHCGRRIENGHVQLDFNGGKAKSNRQEWKEGVV